MFDRVQNFVFEIQIQNLDDEEIYSSFQFDLQSNLAGKEFSSRTKYRNK
jgi:hypothetical protein